MFTPETTLEHLAGQARDGDVRARAALRCHLEREMVPIVRRTIRARANHSPLDRQILTTADRLSRYAADRDRLDWERLVRRVASCMCDTLLERLAGAPAAAPMNETVRM